MKSHTYHVVMTFIVLAVLAAGAAIFAWSGLYNIGADDPHWAPTRAAIEMLRHRSIESRAHDIQVPDLEDASRIRLGAVNYSAMCTGCHLSPGADDTEIRPGLYPMPPDLSKEVALDPKHDFWIIKHGIKLTAMPAWGKTHTDEQIWNMVAFLQKFRGMTPAQYAQLGGKPPAQDEDHMHEGMDGMKGMTGHGASDEAGAAANSHGMDAEQGRMHTHADGTRESHPVSGTVDAHKDDGHPH
ncbi:cytochrome c [Thermomonas sp.]|uniref:c-type cytochrome n=1 Tax=Thermomonas sp. TaxID=1971895 RepID=UPI0024884D9B|nr:cytochrome c [Thermomonas sp.]MDI1253325.1 cytochrome c [Thermomonas sp.]